MLAAIRSAAVTGIDADAVTVEVDATHGLPQWAIVGGAVKESRERVGAALVNAGFVLPPRRLTINLAPGHLPKTGTGYELPIAIGILVATGQLGAAAVASLLFVGELGLDGTIRPIRGALSIARHAASCPTPPTLVVPHANLAEVARVGSLRVGTAHSLTELVGHLQAGTLPAAVPPPPDTLPPPPDVDFSDVVGQDTAKRALEVAAAGGHNLLLIGPPGAGKTMLARRLPTILPTLTDDEALEAIAIHSVAGTLSEQIMHGDRPFRAPHHTISTAGLIGGGSTPRPGEVSLSHHGVLFLDEMLEFPRSVLDALRQPLEDARVVIARATTSVQFPARFTLVAATNPCPCGHAGDPALRCRCRPKDVARYSARLSGPIVDRIDMHVTVGAVSLRDLSAPATGESSAVVRHRVERARAIQRARYQGNARLGAQQVRLNVHASGRWLDAHAGVTPEARRLLHTAASALHFSARAYHRVLKVARTIADIAESEAVEAFHMGEALRYRPTPGGR